MNTELEVVWDGTQRHPITGSRGGLTWYPTREHGVQDLRPVADVVPVGYHARKHAIGDANLEAVYAAVTRGATTVRALIADTGLDQRCVNKHLLRLLAEGRVTRTPGISHRPGSKPWVYAAVAR